MTSQDSQQMAVLDTFPLLRLPPELRNDVYKFALVKEPLRSRRHKPGCVHRSTGPGFFEVPPSLLAESSYKTPSNCSCNRGVVTDHAWRCECQYLCACGKRESLNLLLANRQIHTEASKIFWSDNIFTFENTTQFSEDMDRLRPSYRHCLRHIRIVGEGSTKWRYRGKIAPRLDCVTKYCSTSLRTLEVSNIIVASHADSIYTIAKHFPKLKLTSAWSARKVNHRPNPHTYLPLSDDDNDHEEMEKQKRRPTITVFTMVRRRIYFSRFKPENTTKDNIKHVHAQIPGYVLMTLQERLHPYLDAIWKGEDLESSRKKHLLGSDFTMATPSSPSVLPSPSLTPTPNPDSSLAFFHLVEKGQREEDEEEGCGGIWEVEILGTDDDAEGYRRCRRSLLAHQQKIKERDWEEEEEEEEDAGSDGDGNEDMKTQTNLGLGGLSSNPLVHG